MFQVINPYLAVFLWEAMQTLPPSCLARAA